MPRSPLAVLLVLCSALNVFAAGREVGIPRLAPSWYPASYAAVATNGNGFLAVWRTYTFGAGSHIDGVLLEAAGHRISPAALRIVSFVKDVRTIQLLGVGDHYVLAWTDTEPSFHIAEVDGNGVVTRRIIDRPTPLFAAELLAWNGERFLQAEVSSAIRTTILAGDGSVIESAVLPGSGPITSWSLTVAGSDFVLVTAGTRGTFADWISPDGEQKAHVLIDSSPAPVDVVSAPAGSLVAVVWPVRVQYGNDFLKSVLVSPSGDVVRHEMSMNGLQSFGSQRLFSTGAGFVFVMNTWPSTSGEARPAIVRFDENAVSTDSAPVQTGTSGFVTGSAMSGTTIYAVSTDRTYSGEVIGLTIDPGHPSAAFAEPISIMPVRHISPAIASDGVNFLATWIESPSEKQTLRARLLFPDGSPVFEPVDLSEVSGILGAPTVAFGGGVYLVVWQSGPQLLGKRVSLSGQVLDADPLIITSLGSTASQAAIAWNGSQFLVIWSGYQFGSAFVSPLGAIRNVHTLSVHPPPNESWSFSDSQPSLAWDGTNFLLAWTLIRYAPCSMPPCLFTTEIRIIRLDSAGQPIDAESRLVSDTSRHAAIAAGRANALMVVDDLNGTYARLVDAAGPSLELGNPIDIFQSWLLPLSSVVWTGHDYLVSWRWGMLNQWQLGATHISASGDRDALIGTPTGNSEFLAAPQIAANALGQTLMTVAEFRGDAHSATSARTVVYAPEELATLPRRPSAPRLIDVAGVYPNATVTWEGTSANEDGFVIEAHEPGANPYAVAISPAGAHQISVRLNAPSSLRVRAWNAGGTSEPSEEMKPHTPARRRPAVH